MAPRADATDRIEVRAAGARDLDTVLALLQRQLAEHEITLAPRALEHAVRGLLEQPALGRVLVALVAGEIAGVAVLSFMWTLEHGGAAAWLDELYVDAAQRGRGVGARLVEEAIRVAAARGCIALDLEVEDGHDDAERLYQRLGFHRHRRVRWARRLDS